MTTTLRSLRVFDVLVMPAIGITQMLAFYLQNGKVDMVLICLNIIMSIFVFLWWYRSKSLVIDDTYVTFNQGLFGKGYIFQRQYIERIFVDAINGDPYELVITTHINSLVKKVSIPLKKPKVDIVQVLKQLFGDKVTCHKSLELDA